MRMWCQNAIVIVRSMLGLCFLLSERPSVVFFSLAPVLVWRYFSDDLDEKE